MKVTASDGNGGSVSDEFDIIVSAAANTPATGAPTITGTAQVGQTLTAVTTAIMDANGLTSVSYAYQWIRVATDNTETNIASATASTYTLVDADLGTTIKVRVSFTDDASTAETLTSAATAAVTAAPNTLPSASNGTVTTNEDTAYTFIASEFNFSDADGDTLSNVRIVTLPASGKGTLALSDTPVTANQVVAATNIGTLAYTPPANANGTGYASFTFKVSDGTAESAADYTMTITVTAVNDAPTVANTIPDQPATVGTAFSYAFPANTFSDADTGDTLSYTATKADDTALPTWLSFAASTRTFSGTPTDAGMVALKVTASDGNGGSVSDTFDITVAADTTPPTLISATVVPNGSIMRFQFSETLDVSNLPPVSAFTVTAGGNTITNGSPMQVPGSRDGVALSVSPVILQGQAVVVTYTDPTAGDDANAIQDTAGNDAATFTTGMDGVPAVTNNSTVTNTPATGAPTITGTAQVGQTLTAGTTAIMDANGLTSVSYAYQWIRVATDNTETNIASATASTYTLVDADLGTTIKVKVSFTDDASTAETLTSAATAAVTAAPNTLPSASNGTVTTNEDTAYTFIASEFNFSDADGDTLSNVRIVTLPASGKGTLALSDTPVTANQVVAATNIGTLAYTPPANANGTGYASFTFKVSDGTAESAADYTMTITVTAVNDAPTVANAIPDQSATAGTAFSYAFPDTTFTDADTGDTLSYTATKADDTALPTWLSFAASTRTFSGTPQAADTGTVSVKVTASDGNGGSVSDEFDIIVSAAANTPATGAPTITGTAQVGQTLTAVTTAIMDANGLTSVSYAYQWIRVATDNTETNIASATASTYTLVAADLGTTIKVKVIFTDDASNPETLTSTATAAVAAAANTPATGAPAITGAAQVGQTLTAGTTAIMDADGLTSVSYTYQWIRVDGTDADISGATSITYTLVGADLGTTIKVKVSFTDDASNAETLTSAATAAVAAAAAPTEVPAGWNLKPTSLTTGDKFRLLFLSSTTRDGSSTDIADYNTFVQGLAAAGHADIRTYSAGFRAVGCTADTDARDNTSTTYTTTDKGVPIYWLNGAKAADEYEDFYDGSWDDEANDKNESGTNGLDTSLNDNYPVTGCDHDGTAEAALGASQVTVGRPNSSGSSHGPLNGNAQITGSGLTRPMYGLSAVFQVAAAVVVPNNPPAFSADTADRSVPENTAAAQDVGAVLTATDADSDTLTYTLEGTDAASFDIVSGSGQIRTRTGVTYNHEAKSTHTVVVKADDGNGGTDTVTVTITVTDVDEPPGQPAAPTVSATAGSTTSLDVTWTAPTNTGPAITSYDLQYRQGDSGNFTDGPQDVTGTSAAIGSLAPGTAYQVQVRATNAEGDGEWSFAGTGQTLTTVPGAPTGLTATASGTTAINLSWSAPASTGGSAITGYKIESSSDGGSSWTDLVANTGNANTTYAHTGLTAGDTRHYRVSAINANGTGTASNVDSATTGTTVPGAPSGLTATASGTTAINLSWSAPASTGGSAITGYKIEVSPNGTSGWTDQVANTSSTTTTYAHTGLTAGDHPPLPRLRHQRQRHRHRLQRRQRHHRHHRARRPHRPHGHGQRDHRDQPLLDRPRQHRRLRHHRLQDRGLLRWRLQLDRPGRQHQQHRHHLRAQRARRRHHAPLPRLRHQHQRHRHRLQRRQRHHGRHRPRRSDRPHGNGQRDHPINLSWTAPAITGGSAITGYKIEVSPNGTSGWTDLVANTNSTATTYAHSGLAAGTTRHYRVSAINTNGSGTASNVDSAATATTVPGAPTGLTATASGTTAINLSWSAPASTGGSAITGYKIEVSSDGGSSWTDLVANTGNANTTYAHTGLTAGDTRHYRVSAINANGAGTATTVATVPADWSLKPTALAAGDKFRLLFLSSTKRDGSSTDIATYNTFVQGLAAAGHADIRAYSAGFRAVGCTADTDARDNTSTTYTTTDKGVPIYWLNGAKAADEYEDFYDGSWDDEANDKNESGTNGLDTSLNDNYPVTGCDHDGTAEAALGASQVTVGRPNSSGSSHGPLNGNAQITGSGLTRPMYGLSAVFQVAAAVVVPNNPPAFSADTADRSVPENTAAAQDVGAVLTATDADSDTLTYTLEGTDAASFDIVSGSGQIRTRTGVTYNHEAKSTHTVVVKADDGNGGTDTVTVTITVTDVDEPPGQPAAPTVSATAGSTTSLDVTWTAPTNTGPAITSYDLQYRQGDSGNFTDGPQDVTGTSAAIGSLAPGTAYQVQVRATNAEGDGEWSFAGTGQTLTTVPGAPTGLTATASGTTAINLSWSAPASTGGSAITGYRIEVSSDGGSSWTDLVANTGNANTTYAHTGLTAGDTRHYRVSAINANGTGTASNVDSATTGTTVPGAPSGLSATASGSTQINLSWSAPGSTGGSAITGYKIEVSSNGGSSWTNLVANTGNANTTYAHTGLASGTRATTASPPSTPTAAGTASNVDSATTGTTVPGAPSGLTATASGSTQINLSWSAPAQHRRLRHHRLQDRGLLQWRLQLDQPRRQHEQYHHHLRAHRARRRHHAPLPRVRHQHQRRRHRLQRRQRHHRHHRARRPQRPHGNSQRDHRDQPLLERPGEHRRLRHHRLQDRGLLQWRLQLDRPGRQHQQHHHDLRAHGAYRRHHAPLPRLRHQHQRRRHRLQHRLRHHRRRRRDDGDFHGLLVHGLGGPRGEGDYGGAERGAIGAGEDPAGGDAPGRRDGGGLLGPAVERDVRGRADSVHVRGGGHRRLARGRRRERADRVRDAAGRVRAGRPPHGDGDAGGQRQCGPSAELRHGAPHHRQGARERHGVASVHAVPEHEVVEAAGRQSAAAGDDPAGGDAPGRGDTGGLRGEGAADADERDVRGGRERDVLLYARDPGRQERDRRGPAAGLRPAAAGGEQGRLGAVRNDRVRGPGTAQGDGVVRGRILHGHGGRRPRAGVDPSERAGGNRAGRSAAAGGARRRRVGGGLHGHPEERDVRGGRADADDHGDGNRRYGRRRRRERDAVVRQ